MKEHYHLVGIGGIGMGALASLLLAKGYKVSGSDIKSNELVENLRQSGADIKIGHSSVNVNGADVVVYSSAIPFENPELQAAKMSGIVLMQRASLLAQLMREHIGITVAGAHGKTTTTSLVSHILVEARLHPTTAVGGLILGSSNNARLGAGKYFVAEVDESDRSFLQFSPQYSIITNIDFEHVDQYKDWDDILSAYGQFINGTAKDGMVIACGEDDRLSALCKKAGRPYKTYGFSSSFDIWAEEIRHYGFSTSFDCIVHGNDLGQIITELPGRHNILNALAATGMALTIGIDFKVIQKALKSFPGVKRRFQIKEDSKNILVVDDYGHHPTEIRAALATAQQIKPRRLITVFQPHRYSRWKALMEEFAQALIDTDYLIVTDVYAASEQPIEAVNAEKFVELMKSITDKPVLYLKKDGIVAHLANMIGPGDLVLTLGAGDITHISDELSKLIRLNKICQTLEERSSL